MRLTALLVAGLLTLALVVTVPLPLAQQATLGVLAFFVTLYMARKDTHWSKIALAATALIITTRYLYWRITETLDFSTLSEAVLGYTMLSAECYLWIVLVLSFVQTLQVRDRKPAPLPKDQSQWPTVDVYIPTYNEDLDLVAKTVLAAQRMEYPADKFKIYVLDDGRRPEFARFL